MRYRVERVVNGSARLWIGDGDEPETSQTTATNLRIGHELNMTWDLYCRTVYARQKDVAALDPAHGSDRRRLHVERLLGLGRVRDAANKAKEEQKRLKAVLEGMRAMAEPVSAVAGQLAEAEARAADTPAINAADAAVGEARTAYDAARRRAGAEGVRAARHEALAPRVAALRRAVADAEARVGEATRRCADRDAAVATVARIADQAAGATEAEGRRRRWQALAEVAHAHASATAALAELGFDAVADERDAATLRGLREEQAALIVPEEPAGLRRRVEALVAVEEAGPVVDALEREGAASEAAESARGARADVQARLAAEREHLATLSAGDDASCPVCLRPFDAPRETLVADHEARISALEGALAAARGEQDAAEEALRGCTAARERAARAADALAATSGAATLALARDELTAADDARAAALSRRAELTSQSEALRTALAAREKPRARHGVLAAAAGTREADLRRLARELGVGAYDAAAHLAVTEAAERLTALHEEVLAARAVVGAAAGCDDALTTAVAQLDERRAELRTVNGALAELAFDPEEAARLAAAEEEAERVWDERREAAEALKRAAERASSEVGALRDRLAAAERSQQEIRSTEVELRLHGVTHQILVGYRDAQTQRAWPALEQTAGALMAQATDGRYADVRFSREDFKLMIVDRGDEHAVERYSGGEQDLANLCMRLAIADWIAREREVELGFVVLDEVFGSPGRGPSPRADRAAATPVGALPPDARHHPRPRDRRPVRRRDRARAARAGAQPRRGVMLMANSPS